MRKEKINIKRNTFLYLGLIVLLMTSVFAYYTNVHSFFDESRKNDGFSGLAQERNESDFIEDGCGTDTMLDVVTGLCWDKNFNRDGTMNWTDSKSYCDSSTVAGHNDWYLPSNNELMTLVDEIGEDGSTKITLESFGFLNVQNNYYWSNEECKWNTGYAWYVGFDLGNDSNLDKTSTYYVACVRRNS